jgi:hypothetical protein
MRAAPGRRQALGRYVRLSSQFFNLDGQENEDGWENRNGDEG